MKIRLLIDLPIDPVFGMTKGRIVEVAEHIPAQGAARSRVVGERTWQAHRCLVT